MRRSLVSLAAVSVLALGVLTGCGGDDDSGSDGSGDTGQSSADGTDAETDPEADPDAEGEDDGGEESEPGSSAPEDVCAVLTTEQVGEALGTDGLTVQEVPGGGCNFVVEADPREPSVLVSQLPVDVSAGGFDGLRIGIEAAIGGTAEAVDGVGDDAFLVLGTTPGGSSAAAGGVVLLGDSAIQITLLQSIDLREDDVRERATAVLERVAGAS